MRGTARAVGGRQAFRAAGGRQLRLSQLAAAPLSQSRQRGDGSDLGDHAAELLTAEAVASRHANLWEETAVASARPRRRSDASITADVLVVGAGYLGLSAALHLAEAGAGVVVARCRRVRAGGRRAATAARSFPGSSMIRTRSRHCSAASKASGCGALPARRRTSSSTSSQRHQLRAEARRTAWVQAIHSAKAARRAPPQSRAVAASRRARRLSIGRRDTAALVGHRPLRRRLRRPSGRRPASARRMRANSRAWPIAKGARIHRRIAGRALDRTRRRVARRDRTAVRTCVQTPCSSARTPIPTDLVPGLAALGRRRELAPDRDGAARGDAVRRTHPAGRRGAVGHAQRHPLLAAGRDGRLDHGRAWPVSRAGAGTGLGASQARCPRPLPGSCAGIASPIAGAAASLFIPTTCRSCMNRRPTVRRDRLPGPRHRLADRHGRELAKRAVDPAMRRRLPIAPVAPIPLHAAQGASGSSATIAAYRALDRLGMS